MPSEQCRLHYSSAFFEYALHRFDIEGVPIRRNIGTLSAIKECCMNDGCGDGDILMADVKGAKLL
jgi:hypothetical protein